MDPITIAAIVSAGAALVGPLIGQALSQGDRAKAEALRQEAMRQYNIDLPTVDAIAVQPGILESAAAKAQGSPEAQKARLEALRQLSARAQEGYTVEDRAAINAALGEVAAQERGAREAILAKLPRQSGAQLAAILANQQAAAQQANQMGLDIAAQGRRRALEAIAQKGQLAGQIESSVFGQEMARGEAQDMISKFNEANRLETARMNEANRLAQANRRQALEWEKAQQKAGVLGGMSGFYEGRGQQTRQAVGGTMQGLSSAAGAYAAQQAYAQDPYVRMRQKQAEEELAKLGGVGRP